MPVNELNVDVELQNNILNIDVGGDVVFTYADKEHLDSLVPITNAQINALFA